jgi:hypothetical protein
MQLELLQLRQLLLGCGGGAAGLHVAAAGLEGLQHLQLPGASRLQVRR